MATEKTKNLQYFLILIFLLAVIIQPFILLQPGLLNLTTDKASNLGSAIGGMTAPLITIVSAILIYYSFQQQVKANEMLAISREEDTSLLISSSLLNRIDLSFTEFTFNRSISNYNPLGGTIEYETINNAEAILEYSKHLEEMFKYNNLVRPGKETLTMNNIMAEILKTKEFQPLYYLIEEIKNFTDYLVSLDTNNKARKLYLSILGLTYLRKIEVPMRSMKTKYYPVRDSIDDTCLFHRLIELDEEIYRLFEKESIIMPQNDLVTEMAERSIKRNKRN